MQLITNGTLTTVNNHTTLPQATPTDHHQHINNTSGNTHLPKHQTPAPTYAQFLNESYAMAQIYIPHTARDTRHYATTRHGTQPEGILQSTRDTRHHGLQAPHPAPGRPLQHHQRRTQPVRHVQEQQRRQWTDLADADPQGTRPQDPAETRTAPGTTRRDPPKHPQHHTNTAHSSTTDATTNVETNFRQDQGVGTHTSVPRIRNGVELRM